MLTTEKQRKLNQDLWIICIISGIFLAIYCVFNSSINKILYDDSIPIVLRVLFVGGVSQFGLAGLGITVVTLIRKESFLNYGCCVPDFIYNYFAGNVHAWLPFSDVNTTRM